VKIIISAKRHLKPITRDNDPIIREDHQAFGSVLYELLHPMRAAYIKREIEKAAALAKILDRRDEQKKVPQDGIIARQDESYAILIAEEMMKMTGVPPHVSGSSEVPRAMTTRDLVLAAMLGANYSKNVASFEDNTLMPAATLEAHYQEKYRLEGDAAADQHGCDILEMITRRPEVINAVNLAKKRGEEVVHIDLTCHDGEMFVLAEKFFPQGHPALKQLRDFIGVAPYGGVAIFEIDGIEDLQQLKDFIESKDGQKILRCSTDNIKLLGTIVPRELMAKIVDNVKEILLLAENHIIDGRIKVPDHCPESVVVDKKELEKMQGDLKIISDILATPDYFILAELYPKRPAFIKPDGNHKTPEEIEKEIPQMQEEALMRLKRLDVAFGLAMAVSRRRKNLNGIKEALDNIGTHKKIIRDIGLLDNFTEISYIRGSTLWDDDILNHKKSRAESEISGVGDAPLMYSMKFGPGGRNSSFSSSPSRF